MIMAMGGKCKDLVTTAFGSFFISLIHHRGNTQPTISNMASLQAGLAQCLHEHIPVRIVFEGHCLPDMIQRK